MTNPTEITNIILVEMANTITNVVTNVLDKIDIVDITQPIVWYKNFTFWEMAGTIAIPFVLLWLNNRKEKAEKEEQLLKADREFIQKFIDTRLEIPKFREVVKYTQEERNNFFSDVVSELCNLRLIILPTKYNYLSNYTDKIIPIIRKHNKNELISIIEKSNYADVFPVYYSFTIGSIYMIFRYMYIGEEEFNKVWEEEFEGIKKIPEECIKDLETLEEYLEKLLEDNKKQKQTTNKK